MKIDYTAEQRERAIELWTRILDCHHGVGLAETWEGSYGSWHQSHIDRVSDEWLAALVDSNGAGNEEHNPVVVTLMSYSDYHGSDLDAANIHELQEWPGITASAGNSAGDATMQLGELPGSTDDEIDNGLDQLESIADMLEGLSDYPLISDDAHSEYQTELEDRAWDEWLRHDVIGDLQRVALDGWGITDGVEAELRTAYYGYEENEWSCETATSVHNYRHADALAHAALTVLGWDYPKREAKRKAREERVRAERAEFGVVWQRFLTEYPLPALERRWGAEEHVLCALRERGQLPATVPAILAYVSEQAEIAAYRDAEERVTA